MNTKKKFFIFLAVSALGFAYYLQPGTSNGEEENRPKATEGNLLSNIGLTIIQAGSLLQFMARNPAGQFVLIMIVVLGVVLLYTNLIYTERVDPNLVDNRQYFTDSRREAQWNRLSHE